MSAGKPVFSLEEIEKIADLANLELTQAEKEVFSGQFAEILDYFRTIESVAIEDIPAYATGDANPHFRQDVAERSPVSPESFSEFLENGHFKVPRVIE